VFQSDPKHERNRQAYFSIGDTMNKTRFFFADAAAQRAYSGDVDMDTLFAQSQGLMDQLHHVIAGLLFEYLRIRKADADTLRGQT
jgi:hypothetical protein